MVIALNKSLQDTLGNLLTSTQKQSRNVAFNIQFAALQNTVIDRINKEIIEAENVAGRQTELDRITSAAAKLNARRDAVAEFEFLNTANNGRFNDLTTLATNALIALEVGDADPDSLSEDEVSTYEEILASITTEANRLVELSDPEYFDGDHATKVKSIVSQLQALTPVAGTIDPEGTSEADSTNNNRQIIDLIGELSSSAAAGADTSATLNLMADNVLSRLDLKLRELEVDGTEITVERALEAEAEVERIRAKYATFLRAIEISFDLSTQGIDRISEALSQERRGANTVLSFLV